MEAEKVGYEKYGKDADIQHISFQMEQENYRFSIEALGGSTRKEDRIKRLVPLFEQGRIFSLTNYITLIGKKKPMIWLRCLSIRNICRFR